MTAGGRPGLPGARAVRSRPRSGARGDDGQRFLRLSVARVAAAVHRHGLRHLRTRPYTPARTARPSASSRPAAAGPTAWPTHRAPTARGRWAAGSGGITVADPTARLAPPAGQPCLTPLWSVQQLIVPKPARESRASRIRSAELPLNVSSWNVSVRRAARRSRTSCPKGRSARSRDSSRANSLSMAARQYRRMLTPFSSAIALSRR